jgi:hypothetical protein
MAYFHFCIRHTTLLLTRVGLDAVTRGYGYDLEPPPVYRARCLVYLDMAFLPTGIAG